VPSETNACFLSLDDLVSDDHVTLSLKSFDTRGIEDAQNQWHRQRPFIDLCHETDPQRTRVNSNSTAIVHDLFEQFGCVSATKTMRLKPASIGNHRSTVFRRW
jgi:hypothetical protein